MIVCANCSKENEDFFLFCISCGSSLQGNQPEAFTPIPDPDADNGSASALTRPTDELLESSTSHDSNTDSRSDAEPEEEASPDSSVLPVITYADLTAAESVPAVPLTRPENKSLSNTVVTPLVSHEDLPNDGQGSIESDPIPKPSDSDDALRDDTIRSASTRTDDIELPFLMPLDFGIEASAEKPSEMEAQHVEAVKAERPLEPSVTEERSEFYSDQKSQMPRPSEQLNHLPELSGTVVSAPRTKKMPDSPVEPESRSTAPTDFSAPPIEQVSEIARPPEASEQVEEAPQRPVTHEQPSTGKPKGRKRTRQTQSKKRNRLAGQIVLMKKNGDEGDRFDLFSDSTWLGSSRADINFGNDEFIAPKHAVLFYEDNTLKVRSLDKTNGVFLRLHEHDVRSLRSGDQFRVGQELLQYQAIEDVPTVETTTPDQTRKLGSPLGKETWGFLYQRTSTSENGNVYLLDQDIITLGRDDGEIVFADDGTVSGIHARLMFTDGEASIEDLGSSNGTYMRLHGTTALNDGDAILVGEQVLRIAL